MTTADASAERMPVDTTVEVVVGIVLTVLGGLYLLVHAASIPQFVIVLVIGFGSSSGFWPLLGMLIVAALGVVGIVHGRRRQREHRAFVARVAAMRKSHPAPAAPPAPPPGIGIAELAKRAAPQR